MTKQTLLEGDRQAAFFFDRDGVINCDPHPQAYVLSWRQWQWMEGVRPLLAWVKALQIKTILVTSQRGVGKGLMSVDDLNTIHHRMQLELGALSFDAIHAYTGLEDCRFEAKPSPQMIWEAEKELRLDLKRSWLLGDADRDIEMAQAAGVAHSIRLRGLKPIGVAADHTVDTLTEVIALLTK